VAGDELRGEHPFDLVTRRKADEGRNRGGLLLFVFLNAGIFQPQRRDSLISNNVVPVVIS
jgi:hypothetical protein